MSHLDEGKLGVEVANLLVHSLSDRLLYGNCPAQINQGQFEGLSSSLSRIDLNMPSLNGYSGIELADSPVLIGRAEEGAPALYLNLRRLVYVPAFLNAGPSWRQRATFGADKVVSAWASNRTLYQAQRDPKVSAILTAYHPLFVFAKLESRVERRLHFEDNSEGDFYVTKETPLFGVVGISPHEMKVLRAWETDNSPLLDRVRYRRKQMHSKQSSERIPLNEYLKMTDRTEKDEREAFI